MRAENVLRNILAKAATTQKRLAAARKKAALPSQEDVEKWRRMLDPQQTSIAEFIELWKPKVNTKEVQKDGTIQLPFVMWPSQRRILATVEDAWEAGHAAKIYLLKDREQGCSFFIQMLLFIMWLRGGGGEARTISHKDDATLILCADFESLMKQVPEFVFTHLLQAEITANSTGEWELSFPGGYRSNAQTMTCRDDALGRGDRIRWLHLSEYPWWKSGKGGLKGLIQTLADVPGNIYIIESTGKDFDEFHRGCVAARDGRSGWDFLFLTWLTHPKKTMRFASESLKERFREQVGQDDRYDQKKERLLVQKGATLEQLHWRRKTIDARCEGDCRYFAREHPDEFLDAFYAESDCPFYPEILNARLPAAEREWRSGMWKRGNLKITDAGKKIEVAWEVARDGVLWIRETPQKGESYCFGCDPSSGKKIVDQGTRVGDYATIEVRRVRDKAIVAMFHAHRDPDKLAFDVIAVSKWYGWAPGYVESNNDGKVTMNELEKLSERWDIDADFLLPQVREVPTTDGRRYEYHPGFLSDPASKPIAIEKLRRWMREIGMPKDGEESLIPFPLLDEMLRYRQEQNLNRHGQPTGRFSWGASSGHDDRVTASYLCLEAWEHLDHNDEKVTKVEDVARPADEEFEAMMRKVRAEMGEPLPETKLYHPHGGRAPGRDEDAAEIPGMKGF